MTITVLLVRGMHTTGADSKRFTVLPIGGTVAMGRVCILETVFTIGGTATVGKTCARAPLRTGWRTAGAGFRTDVLPNPICSNACDEALEGAAA